MLLFKTSINNTTCLYVASEQGHLEVVKTLLKAGGEALLPIVVEGKGSCLYVACTFGHVEVVKTLIQAGGTEALFEETWDGSFGLFVASQYGYLETVKVLAKAGGEALMLKTWEEQTSLFIACHMGHLHVVKALIRAGGEGLVKICTSGNASCLHAASARGHTAVVAYLLTLPSCADLVCLQDASGRAPLDYALARGHADIAKAIIRRSRAMAGPASG